MVIAVSDPFTAAVKAAELATKAANQWHTWWGVGRCIRSLLSGVYDFQIRETIPDAEGNLSRFARWEFKRVRRGGWSSLGILLDVLVDGTYDDQKRRAVALLKSVNDRHVLVQLMGLLHRRAAPRLRVSIAVALSTFDSDDARRAVLLCLHDHDVDMVRQVVRLVPELETAESGQALLDRYKYCSEDSLRHDILDALLRLQGQEPGISEEWIREFKGQLLNSTNARLIRRCSELLLSFRDSDAAVKACQEIVDSNRFAKDGLMEHFQRFMKSSRMRSRDTGSAYDFDSN